MGSCTLLLPFTDWHVMETYMDDQREMKQMMYDLFKAHPEMLTPVEEGLTKGLGEGSLLGL